MLSFFILRKLAPRIICFYSAFVCIQCYGQQASVPVADNISFTTSEYDRNSAQMLSMMRQVDSISHTTGIASHFAKIYTASMGNINVQLQGLDSGAQAFVKKFEISFIGYFLEACDEYNTGKTVGSVWNFYFTHPEAEPWQLTMIGVNAHINGDIWKGLVKNFSEEEIRKYKKNLLSFQSSISKAFQPFFEELLEESAYLRFMDNFTKGMARHYGEWLIYNWRRRQIDLATLYYTDTEKFKKHFATIEKKKQHIDEKILKNTKLPKF